MDQINVLINILTSYPSFR